MWGPEFVTVKLQEGSCKGQGQWKAEVRCGHSMRLHWFLHCMNGRLPWLAREKPSFLFTLLGWSSPSLLLWWWYWSGCWCRQEDVLALAFAVFKPWLIYLPVCSVFFFLFMMGWVSHASLAWLVGFHDYITAWFVCGVTSFTSKESHDAGGGGGVSTRMLCRYVTPLSFDRW